MIFIMTPKDLTIKLEGFERFWSVKSKIRLPADCITSIEYQFTKPKLPSCCWFRVGTAMPRVLYAGTFIKKGVREFWYLRPSRRGVLNIALKTDHAKYDKIRLSVRASAADDVLSWWDGR